MTAENIEDIWQSASEQLRGMLNEDVYDRWIAGIVPVRLEKNTLVLGVSNDVFCEWLSANYRELIADTVRESCGQGYKIDFEGGHEFTPIAVKSPSGTARNNGGGRRSKRSKGSNASREGEDTSAPTHAQVRNKEQSYFNRHFTFDTFVIADNNRFAYAAASAVAKTPGKAYNPLFIHGATTLGKTHLLQAVAQDALGRRRKSRIEYLTSEDFTNQFIEALQYQSLPKFRQRMRGVDILLIDDVQFFTGKEQLQEEFFHTFNTLFNNHRQIIMTSDRPPHEIGGLEKRLVSRFEWGLTTEIMAPNIETRMAILKKKQEEHSIKLDDPVLFFIADRIRSNIRRLEGALIQLVSYASLANEKITQERATTLLRPLLEEEGSSSLTVEEIQRAVAEHYDIRLTDMSSKRRPQNIAFPRQVAMYLARHLTHDSLPRIADSFNRNHATILHAVSTIEKKMSEDQEISNTVNKLERRLKVR